MPQEPAITTTATTLEASNLQQHLLACPTLCHASKARHIAPDLLLQHAPTMEFTDDLFGDSSWQPFDQLPAGTITAPAAASAAPSSSQKPGPTAALLPELGPAALLPELQDLHKRQMSLGGVSCTGPCAPAASSG